MIYNDRTIFTLTNGLAAISATRQNGRISATDGQNCQIHLLDSTGQLTDRVCTARAYRRLRRIGQSDSYTATSCCDSSDIFILDSGFEENARITLDSQYGCTRCGINGIADAEAVCWEDNIYFTAAFAEGAYLFDKNGARINRLCRAEYGESLTDFITFGKESYAFATLCGNTQTVSISVEGELQSGTLSHKYVLRMLFFENSTVYGLFGRDYIYNHIIPIYTNGVLTLPR